jgi:hypothetical protein
MNDYDKELDALWVAMNRDDDPMGKHDYKQRLKSLLDKAYEHGRINEAKACEKARRHDYRTLLAQAKLNGAIEELEKMGDVEFEEVPIDIIKWRYERLAALKEERSKL